MTAARALGYAQVIADLDGGGDGTAAREPTFVGTRRYVRRQRSWFRRDHRIKWLDGAAADNVERHAAGVAARILSRWSSPRATAHRTTSCCCPTPKAGSR